MPATDRLEHLEPVHELNRSFLGFLQSRARVERDCLGLPATARPPLRAADSGLLDDVAQFPRALFQVRCKDVAGSGHEPVAAGERGARYHDLALSILLAARQASRQSPYQAQFLLGLGVAEIQWLRSLALPDLARSRGGLGRRALRVRRPGLAVARPPDRYAPRVAPAARARRAAARGSFATGRSGDPRIPSPDARLAGHCSTRRRPHLQ